jgi:hypothetical protein
LACQGIDVGARSGGCEAIDGPHPKEDRLVGGEIRKNVYCVKPHQRVRSFTGGRSEVILACLGPDQREDILPEARSERTKLRAGGRSEGIYTS